MIWLIHSLAETGAAVVRDTRVEPDGTAQ